MPRSRPQLLAAILFLSLSLPLLGHDLKTARGRKVNHNHDVGSCNGKTCASDWAEFEKQAGFKRADLVYAGTGKWNCHGRTFDNRKSWVSYADDWLATDNPSCPAKPKAGDTIIWVEKGKTTHSVTITGSWKDTKTIVMSKYGILGQYEHSLANVVRMYGSRWTVTRFGAGTKIYSAAVGIGDDMAPPLDGPDRDPTGSPAERLLKLGEAMPWHSAVVESEAIFREARARDLETLGRLTDATVAELELAETDEERARLFVADLQDSSHYVMLGAFNFPQPEFIDAVKATEHLVALARNPTIRDFINVQLRELVTDENTADASRAAALKVLDHTLQPWEKSEFLQDLAVRPETLTSVFVERIARESTPQQ
jgi:hypothetical protein